MPGWEESLRRRRGICTRADTRPGTSAKPLRAEGGLSSYASGVRRAVSQKGDAMYIGAGLLTVILIIVLLIILL
jgi:hypothetical protein